MKREFEKTLRMFFFGVGLVLLCVAFFQVWVHYYNPNIRLPFYRRGNYMLTLMYGAILFVCVIVMKGQNIGKSQLLEVIISQCIALLMTAVIIYFPMSLLQYELLDPIPLIILTLGQWVLVVLWNLFANKLFFRLVPPLKMLYVTDGRGGGGLAAKLNRIPDRYNVAEEISVSVGKDVLRKRILEFDAVLLSVLDDEWRSWLVRQCFKRDAQIFLVPTVTDVIVNRVKAVHAVDTPLLCSTGHHLSIEDRVLKRAMDIAGSVFAIILTSPVLLVTAAAIKLGDGGPVFFMQERLTRDGRVFKICKFRSMVVDAEKDGQRLAAEHDERVTPVGRIIRKLRIDELPQFFNVLKGDMSLVGPRPECPALAAEYEKALPPFAYRLKVKAGITGYAQVYGDYSTDPADKLMMDIMYIESSNIVLDINLLFLTIRVLFLTDKTKGAAAPKREASE